MGDRFINSHNLSLDSVWILLGENCSWSLLGLKGLRRGYNPTVSHLYIFYIQWTPVNTVNNGPEKSGSINGVAVSMTVFFYKKMYGGFYRAAKKSGRNNELAVSRGFTVKKVWKHVKHYTKL